MPDFKSTERAATDSISVKMNFLSQKGWCMIIQSNTEHTAIGCRQVPKRNQKINDLPSSGTCISYQAIVYQTLVLLA